MATEKHIFSDTIRKYLWVVLLIGFLVVFGFGLFRGEAIDVFEKARTICIECIGIG
jgi:hypothetical protein